MGLEFWDGGLGFRWREEDAGGQGSVLQGMPASNKPANLQVLGGFPAAYIGVIWGLYWAMLDSEKDNGNYDSGFTV